MATAKDLKAVKTAIKGLGIVATLTDFDEIRIVPKGKPEAQSYYTDDAQDAISTALDMAMRVARQWIVRDPSFRD